MLTLAIDTSTNTAGCALLEEERVLAECLVNLGMNHSATLLPSIHHMVSLADVRMADIDLFACTVGPGSFTGLRIGVSTIKGFALATGKPVAGVSALEALACNVTTVSMLICPMLDAKKNQVYAALFKADRQNGIARIGEEAAVEVDKFLSLIQGDCIFVGDGAAAYQDAIKNALPGHAYFASPIHQSIRASAVGLLGMRKFAAGDTLDPFHFMPRYLRLSEAEVKR
jgi:tRNA threonylcarbamoyladenosine biosynthesis protein TsaB